jgi:Skp family chaperone for outer membrane proteins
MKKRLTSNLGWAVAAALACALFISGFAQEQPKEGVVNLGLAIKDSKLGLSNTDRLRNAIQSRDGLLQYIQTEQIVTPNQANELKELELKEGADDADKARVEVIKGEITAAVKEFTDLSTKGNLTAEEQAKVTAYSGSIEAMRALLPGWQQEFQSDLNALQTAVRQEESDAVKAALEKVAKDEGYTLVHDSTVVPFCVNDLTEKTKKALDDAQK